MDPFWYGFFFGPGLIMISVGLVVAFVTAAFGWASRPHDTRMNTQQMIFSVWSRWLDHKERRESLYIDALKQPVKRVELAEPVKRAQLSAPEVIEGVVVYSETEMRAAKRIAQSRAVEVSNK